VNVSAVDKATSKEQKVTITSSSGLTDGDIDTMVKDAEEHAAADAEKRKAIETRNQGDSLVYQTEKLLSELGDKVSETEKTDIEAAVKILKDAVEQDDLEAIEKGIEAVTQKSHALAEKLYQAGAAGAPGADMPGADAGAAGAAGPDMDPPGGNDDDIIDADFEETT